MFGWGPEAGPDDFQQIGLDGGVDQDVAHPELVHEALAPVQELRKFHAQAIEAFVGAVLDDLVSRVSIRWKSRSARWKVSALASESTVSLCARAATIAACPAAALVPSRARRSRVSVSSISQVTRRLSHLAASRLSVLRTRDDSWWEAIRWERQTHAVAMCCSCTPAWPSLVLAALVFRSLDGVHAR